MKKVFLSAIMVIAFSGAAMANNSNVANNNKALVDEDCTQTAISIYEWIMDNGCGRPACGGDNPRILNDLMSLCAM